MCLCFLHKMIMCVTKKDGSLWRSWAWLLEHTVVSSSVWTMYELVISHIYILNKKSVIALEVKGFRLVASSTVCYCKVNECEFETESCDENVWKHCMTFLQAIRRYRLHITNFCLAFCSCNSFTGKSLPLKLFLNYAQ